MCTLPLELEQIVWKMVHAKQLAEVHQEYEEKFKPLWNSQQQSFCQTNSCVGLANYRALIPPFLPWTDNMIHRFQRTKHLPRVFKPLRYSYSRSHWF